MRLDVCIKKKLGDFQLDVGFVLNDETGAIYGASGSGKTMILKCIAGIEAPDEGHIVLGDKILYDSEQKINLPPQERHIGYMFQDYALFPHMTVEQNIEIACKKDLPEDYYDRFHISNLKDMYPAQLSGGQKQRVAMARMLAVEPQVVLFDEPFSALDKELKEELMAEVKEILERYKRNAIFVSHDMDEIECICSKIGHIREGLMDNMTYIR